MNPQFAEVLRIGGYRMAMCAEPLNNRFAQAFVVRRGVCTGIPRHMGNQRRSVVPDSTGRHAERRSASKPCDIVPKLTRWCICTLVLGPGDRTRGHETQIHPARLSVYISFANYVAGMLASTDRSVRREKGTRVGPKGM